MDSLRRPPAPVAASAMRTPLIDGIDKVTGRASTPPTSLRPARWSAASCTARIRTRVIIVAIDTRAAEALEACARVHRRGTPVPFGVLPIAENEYPLARGKVRYRGDPVAAVAAIDGDRRTGARADRGRSTSCCRRTSRPRRR